MQSNYGIMLRVALDAEP